MDFGHVNRPVGKPNLGYSLSLPPPTFAVAPTEPRDFSNPRANRKCLNLADRTKKLKIHSLIVPNLPAGVNGKYGLIAGAA